MEYWLIGAVVACMVFVIIRQQLIIDRLNDRLMARNYGEYKSKQIKEEDASPEKEDEPKGWYDH